MRRRYDFELDKSPEDGNGLLHLRRNSRTGLYSESPLVGFAILIYLLLLFVATYKLDEILPTPLMRQDEINHPEEFIAERAEFDLKHLTNSGPRVVGSYENEQITVDFLVRRIKHLILSANTHQDIEYDVQLSSGGYFLDYHPYGQINSYSNVQNVIVKLHGEKNNSKEAVLLNSHFDSVPTSPGGSDDGISVVSMLEILRIFAKSNDRPLHNIIFLFNGAEESVLQASHGFITQHKWAKECKVLVNLEACGAGGKIILFQTGPNAPWLVDYYSKIPFPYGQVAGEEIFQSGLIPSDTDFRIFRDFGGLIGLDMAFFKNGYRYHTKYDGFSNIPLGSYQHIGSNTLSLVKFLSNAPELGQNLTQRENVIYFDVFGLFMIVYSLTTATILNLLTAILSLGLFAFNLYSFNLGLNKKDGIFLGLSLAAILIGWLVSGLFAYLFASLLDFLNVTMSWYGSPPLIFGLYCSPFIGIMGYILLLVNHKNLAENIRCQVQADLNRVIWTLVLIVGTIGKIRSSFAIFIPILFHTLASVVITGLKWQHQVKRWKFIYIVFLLIPTMLLMYQANTTFSLFIPLSGRMGATKNPEMTIAFLTLVFTILIGSPYVVLITCLRSPKYIFIVLGSVFAITAILAATPIGFPYSGDSDAPTPQRHWIVHSSRIFYNESGDVSKTDAGLFMVNMDRNSPYKLKNYIKDLSREKEIDCQNYILCGVPLPHVRMLQVIEKSTWIPANQPLIRMPLNFTVVSKENTNSSTIRFTVSLTGPDRLAVYLVPKKTLEIGQIDIVKPLPKPQTIFHGRKVYYISHAFGKAGDVLKFSFDVISKGNISRDDKVLDFIVTGIYVHEKLNPKTPYYVNLIKQFPDWADVTAFIGSYSNWII